MKAIEIELTPDTYERAAALASARGCSIHELLTGIVHEALAAGTPSDGLTGLFADEPELLDAVVEEAMQDRERRWATSARE